MIDVAVIDYGMGNLHSVEQALCKVAPEKRIIVSDDARVIAKAGRVVFPGQGAMPECMREIEARGLRNTILEAARDKPFLGICIGLQMLFEHSTEGDVPGLGILHGNVVRFAANLCDTQGNKLKVPHMGWNQVHQLKSCSDGDVAALHNYNDGKMDSSRNHVMWNGIAQDARFYFVHSYYVCTQNAALVQATSNYPQPFDCAVAQENLFAVQFHPEKSQTAGLKLLQNFVYWDP